ncbi:topology modulation protein [Cytobacillus sp. Sa5YUA1]|uniref:Topology modulation protein n=1 Tax=Cytobacillus stercorigallinarum TaxID=2762240 RepID=A0ABR8QS37_9BACI|nr:topology modulation protein [Cytobacillus stercorigallinarum]MBD7938345.1 topology modulation protein [Cytobacillus stercorigallinarum]
MKKIMVIGISAGVGKSTFARKLGEKLQINVHHLDTLYWLPNWQASSEERFIHLQQDIAKQPVWIIEGNYTGTFSIRTAEADTIIYLELPLLTCLYRIVKRRIQFHKKSRPDMTNGCQEKIDWAFIKFVVSTYYRRKKKMYERFRTLKKEKPELKVVILRNNGEMEAYLANKSL